MSPLKQFIALLVLAFGAHAWNLGGEFVFDDGVYIVMNPAVQMGLTDWTRFFTDPSTYAGAAMSHYRPFVALSYAADVSMGLGIVGFKLTQVVLHVMTVLGLFWVGRRLVQALKLELPGLPFLAAALFAIMPFNVEAVHYLTGRSAVMCGLFSVIAVGLFLELRRRDGGRASKTTIALLYLAHLAALGMALLSKETALTLPGLLFVLDLLLVLRRGAGGLATVRFWWPYLPYVAGLSVALAIMPNVELVGAYFAKVFGEEWRFAAAIYCLLENIRLMVLPVGLTLAHPINEAGKLTDPLTIACAAGVVILIASAVAAWRRAPLWSLGLAWYFLLIAPSTFVHLNTILMENRGYTASMGICLIFAWVLAILWSKRRWQKTMAVAVTALAVVFLLVGYQRQQVWASSLNLWRDAVAHDATSEEAWANLGTAHFNRGEWRLAERAFVEALKIRPDAALVMVNLAGVYLKDGRSAQALPLMQRLVALEPNRPGYLVNLFHAQSAQGQLAEALVTMKSLLQAEANNLVRRRYVNPLLPGQSATTMVDLALRLGRADQAAWAIYMVKKSYPNYPLTGLLEMRLYAATGQLSKAGNALDGLAARLPGDARIRGWRQELARYRAVVAPKK